VEGALVSEEAPAGYVTMNAGEIKKAVEAAITKRKDEHKAWLEALTPKLVAWRNRKGWMNRFDMWGAPKDPEKLTEWYLKHGWYHRPSIKGLDPEPRVSDFQYDWRRRVGDLADDKQVFVAIDDAAVHMSWLRPS